MIELRPWTLPLIIAAILVPVIAGFAVAGPVLGLALGFAVAAVIVVIAARQRPGGPIETASATDARRHVLVVLTHELDEPSAIDRIKREAGLGRADAGVDVLILAPAKSRLLDRWATDLEPGRQEAQRKLVVSVASLGKADVSAEAVVGDQDIVQAVEDQLRGFPADEVVLVTGSREGDPDGDRAATELDARLPQRFSRIVLNGS